MSCNCVKSSENSVATIWTYHMPMFRSKLHPTIGPWKFRDKNALFACFLKLGGSIWAITVLDVPGILLRRSGHPTSLYLERKEFPKKLGRGNLGLGPNSPFRAPWGPEGAQYQVEVCVHHESNSGGPMGGSWDQIWTTGALQGPWGPFGAKTSPLGPPVGT